MSFEHSSFGLTMLPTPSSAKIEPYSRRLIFVTILGTFCEWPNIETTMFSSSMPVSVTSASACVSPSAKSNSREEPSPSATSAAGRASASCTARFASISIIFTPTPLCSRRLAKY